MESTDKNSKGNRDLRRNLIAMLELRYLNTHWWEFMKRRNLRKLLNELNTKEDGRKH